MTPEEAEERQALLKELREQWKDFDERFCEPGYGTHELSDRASILADSWAGYIQEHPACVGNAEWFELAREIADKMMDFYQKTALFDEDSEHGSSHVLRSGDTDRGPPGLRFRHVGTND